MTLKSTKTIALSLLLFNFALSIVIWQIDPDKVGVVPAGGLLLPTMLGIILILGRMGIKDIGCACSQRAIFEHVVIAALMISSGLLITLTNITGITEGDMSKRYLGAILGVLIVYSGNRIPKQISTKETNSEKAALQIQIQRSIGYIMVISGLLMTASWIVLPESVAGIAFISIGLLMTIVIVARCIRLNRKHVTA